MKNKNIQIIKFAAKYAADFKRINLEWLEKYGLTEEPDLLVLNDPEGQIINKGGFIFFAIEGETIAGTAALIKESPTQYELVKMAVDPAYQGQGISKLLIEICILTAQNKGAKKIYLQSNSQLKTAIALYENYGFKHIPVTNAHYLTADVMMELLL